jgi:glycerophosphoryl diester phosphodiesterase
MNGLSLHSVSCRARVAAFAARMFQVFQPGPFRSGTGPQRRVESYGHHLTAAHRGRHGNMGSSTAVGDHELLSQDRARHAVRWLAARAALVLALSAFGVAMVSSETAQAHGGGGDRSSGPLVLGHRGASGYVPEHTLTSYFVAIQDGADFVEPDLVMTKDGVLVARHENEIGGTTNVAEHPEFADRKTTKVIDGVSLTGWFTEDFTIAELKTLRARERIPQIRPANTRFDGQFEVPTFEEVLGLVRAIDKQREEAARQLGKRPPKPIGVYPETKHPTYFRGLNLAMEVPVVRTLKKFGYEGRHAPIFIQSFEVQNLKDLSRITDIRLIQLLSGTGAPFDFVASGSTKTYADLITPAGLKDVARYAYGIGPDKSMVIPRLSDGRLGTPTALVQNAHKAGLKVHPYTFRVENSFLPLEFRSSTDPTGLGDLAGEITAFLNTGIDGFFTDNANLGVQARDAFVEAQAD